MPFFADLKGEPSYENTLEYIQAKFTQSNLRHVLTFILSCTDAGICVRIMNTIYDSLLGWAAIDFLF